MKDFLKSARSVVSDWPDKCQKCGADLHPTYYHDVGGIEISRMYKCGSMRYDTGYFKQSSSCKENAENLTK